MCVYLYLNNSCNWYQASRDILLSHKDYSVPMFKAIRRFVGPAAFSPVTRIPEM